MFDPRVRLKKVQAYFWCIYRVSKLFLFHDCAECYINHFDIFGHPVLIVCWSHGKMKYVLQSTWPHLRL